MKKCSLFLLALLLLTGCSRKEASQEIREVSTRSETVAALQAEASAEVWAWPIYEMEKTTVYDNNGVLISIDAIHQKEDDPSVIYFTYTVENHNNFKVKVDIYDALVNGYSTDYNIVGAQVDPGETVTRDSRFSVRVPKGYEDIVIHFRNGVLHNASIYKDIDRSIEFTVCTTGADPDMKFTYPSGTLVIEDGGIRIENLGHLKEEDLGNLEKEPGKSIFFIIFNDSEADLNTLTIKPKKINGIDISNAENTPFYQYFNKRTRANSAHVMQMQLNPEFQREFPEIQQVESLTADISWGGSTFFETLGVEIPVNQ